MANMDHFGPEQLNYLITHIVLPPKLPHSREVGFALFEQSIARWLCGCVQQYRQEVIDMQAENTSLSASWNSVETMLHHWVRIHGQSEFDAGHFVLAMESMVAGGSIGLHLRAQNASLLIHRHSDEVVSFEAFEVSARNVDIMTTQGRLKRAFPGQIVKLNLNKVQDINFRREFADIAASLYVETIEEAAPTTTEAGSQVYEPRDTTHPKLVTEYLMNVLAACGAPSDVDAISKHIREDVLWDNYATPWRRSPTWIALRVSVQLLLRRLGMPAAEYKNFMLFCICRLATATLHSKVPDNNIRDEHLFVMSAKIARRNHKLSPDVQRIVQNKANQAVQEIRAVLDRQWSRAQQIDGTPVPSITSDINTTLQLETSAPQIKHVFSRVTESLKSDGYHPEHPARMKLLPKLLPKFEPPADRFEALLCLADLEKWVSKYNDTWAAKDSRSEQDCVLLMKLITSYTDSATRAYKNCPREMSGALLTILDLWISLDIIATRLLTTLKQYPPEIPTDFLHTLLLPEKSQMLRAQKIEQHLARRFQECQPNNPSIFGDPSPNSFECQYFDGSTRLRDLCQKIERKAKKYRQLKVSELEQEEITRQTLEEQAAEMDCTFTIEEEDGQKHDPRCQKCRKTRRAINMRIKVHEWPLPEKQHERKTVVFELSPPAVFSAWRDATWGIIHELGRGVDESTTRVHTTIFNYEPLREYAYYGNRRIYIGSASKPFIEAHYRDRKLPTSIGAICVKNGLQYRRVFLSGNCKNFFATDQSSKCSIERFTEQKIPPGPYEGLQWTIDSTHHTSNEVLARQSECPTNLDLRQYLAFASLRAGPKLQLYNIVRELGGYELSFNEDAVYTLLQRAAWQAGSPAENSIYREPHLAFLELSFCSALSDILKRKYLEIEANSKELTTMSIVVDLAVRLLALTPFEKMKAEVATLLRDIRGVALRWCRELSAEVAQRQLDTPTKTPNSEAVIKAALVSLLTMDSEDLDAVFANQDDVSSYIQSIVLLQDNLPADTTNFPETIQSRLIRAVKVAHSVERKLRDLVFSSASGINKALAEIWNEFAFENPWKCLQEPAGRWLENSTAKYPGKRSITVLFNTLDGQLLANGRSLSSIPEDYKRDQLFGEIFGKIPLRVMVSNMPGMVYMATQEINGYQVHFGLNYQKVIVRLMRGDKIYELLRPEVFESDFPTWFSEKCFQLLDLGLRQVEFRPRSEFWSHSSSSTWTLKLSSMPSMRLGQKLLLAGEEATNSQIIEVLSVLENAKHIHLTLDDEGTLTASLHRMGLTFSLNSAGALECVELNATVDDDQSIGCLFGLKDKLVLRSKSGQGKNRSVLIPFGPVIIAKAQVHVNITVQDFAPDRRQYFQFGQDEDLLRLTEPPTLSAALYLTFLHAITSSPLPDPFTGRTGTEEALKRLREPRFRDNTRLDDDELLVLDWILRLSPKRVYCPAHLKVMQQTTWHEALNTLAQNEDFSIFASKIALQHAKSAIFDGSPSIKFQSEYGSSDLRWRSKIRLAGYRNSDVANLKMNRNLDCEYSSRDLYSADAGCSRVFSLCSTVRQWPPTMDIPQLLDVIESWSSVDSYGSSFNIKSVAALVSINLADHWGGLYDTFRKCSRFKDQYYIMFVLGAIVYQESKNLAMCQILLAIARWEEFRDMSAPFDGEFRLYEGHSFNREEIYDLLRKSVKPFDAASFPISQRSEERRKHEEKADRQLDEATKALAIAWEDDAQPTTPRIRGSPLLLNLDQAMQDVKAQFKKWRRNLQYLQHISEVDQNLRLHQGAFTSLCFPEAPKVCVWNLETCQKQIPSFKRLLGERDTPELNHGSTPLEFHRSSAGNTCSQEQIELRKIFESLVSESPDRLYLDRLSDSLNAFERNPLPLLPHGFPTSVDCLLAHAEQTRNHLKQTFEALKSQLEDKRDSETMLQRAGLWPTITPQTLLKILSRSWAGSNILWRESVARFARDTVICQRACRLIDFFLAGDILSFFKEAENPGCKGWSRAEYPEWLLLEIESGICIRHQQAVLALAMMSSNQPNAVFQLNMGEGKSSVVLPMIAAAAADGTALQKFLTLPSLQHQTSSQLRKCLGRLIDMRVYNMPFTRHSRVDTDALEEFEHMFHKCKKGKGIIVATAENFLSFRLMGFNKMHETFDDGIVAEKLLQMDKSLQSTSKDVLDESDEILNVKFQLVYAVGTQRSIEGAPDRWFTCLAVLALVKKCAITFAKEHPTLLEVTYINASFPLMRFYDESGYDFLLSAVLSRVLESDLPQLSFRQFKDTVREALRDFVRKLNVPQETTNTVGSALEGTDKLNVILFLRGLFAHGVLKHALTRRWFVQYGLDLSRCLMAVPYRAKGQPSPSAEFSHPDIALLLTSMSYYYTGLEHGQLRQVFNILQRQTDALDEYSSWCQCDGGIPVRFSSLMSINLDDESLCEDLFSRLKHNERVIDFYLHQVVFPREAKEFHSKLSTSAWDIPAKSGAPSTSGFSGTNDNQNLLPLSIEQKVVPGLEHTNALVLTTILKARNRQYQCACDANHRNLSSKAFLTLISSKDNLFQVVIDVGAQILDLTNFEVAQAWLESASNAKAAVFFDDNHIAQVLDRAGGLQTLSTSIFRGRLDGCLVYFDEAHARGVDLALPDGYRAAIYLGPETSKDKLMQAAMRMRKLDHTQSLKFFAPMEVHKQIAAASHAEPNKGMDSSHVLRWCLRQTQELSEKSKPLWFQHGYGYARREYVCDKFSSILNLSDSSRSSHLQQWNEELLEPEAQTLSDMYGIHESANFEESDAWISSPLAEELNRLGRVSNIGPHRNRSVAEEQEREVEIEVEREKQVQRPPNKAPLRHDLTEEVQHFAFHGHFRSLSMESIQPAFTVWNDTSAQPHSTDVSCFPNIYATRDFALTVRLNEQERSDEFLRPARWIISSCKSPYLLIISPFEANMLITNIRESKVTTLHVYAPKTTKDMISFSNLQFCSVSGMIRTNIAVSAASTPILVLNLFAGPHIWTTFTNIKNFATFWAS